MFPFEKSATFWQTRIEGEGHLAIPCLEKAFRQLITGYSAVAGEGNTARCVYFTPCGHLGQREAPGRCASAICHVVESLVNPLLSSFPSSWVGAGQLVQMCKAFRQITAILRQVRQGCFGEIVFFSMALFPPPTLSCLAGLLPWPGWAGGSTKDSVRANDKCNSV